LIAAKPDAPTANRPERESSKRNVNALR